MLFLDVAFVKPCLLSVDTQICPSRKSTIFFQPYSSFGRCTPCGFAEDHTTSGWTNNFPPPINLQDSSPIYMPMPKIACSIISSNTKSHCISIQVVITWWTSSFVSLTISANPKNRDAMSRFDHHFQYASRYSGPNIYWIPSKKFGSSNKNMFLRCRVVILSLQVYV